MENIPAHIYEALNSLVSGDQTFKWKLHARNHVTTLVLSWSQPGVENHDPAKPVRHRRPPSLHASGRPVVDCLRARPTDSSNKPTKQLSVVDIEVRRKRKKKSPSTLKRDRERLENWKTRKEKKTFIEIGEPAHKLDLPPFDNFVSGQDSQVINIKPPDINSVSNPAPVPQDESVESVPQVDPGDCGTSKLNENIDILTSLTNRSGLTFYFDPDDDDPENSPIDSPGRVCCLCGKQESELIFTERLKACTGCYFTIYCSRECQVHHWKTGHKDVCKSLLKSLDTVREKTTDFQIP